MYDHPPPLKTEGPLTDEHIQRALQAAGKDENTKLSEEQLAVLKDAWERNNIFLTGSAGVGKSLTLQVLIELLKLRYGSDRVFTTASTGIAAVPLNGTTLHKWAGVPVTSSYKTFNMMMSRNSRARIWNTSALIIDEISMVSASSIYLPCLKDAASANLLKGAASNGPFTPSQATVLSVSNM